MALQLELRPSSEGAESTDGRSGPMEIRLGVKPGRISARERMFFTERLGLLLDTDNPLHLSLEAIAGQAGAGELANVLRAVVDDVSSGASFADALARWPESFPPTYVSTVRAAEAGGFLPAALASLVEIEERHDSMRAAVTSAFAYPAFLATLSAAVIVFVLVAVFPKFEDLFAMIADELPITTKGLLAASRVLRAGWVPILAGAGALGVAAWAWLRRPEGREALDGWLLRIPGIRTILIHTDMVQLLRVMALSAAHGVNALEMLASARDSVSSPTFRRFVERLAESVERGGTLGAGFRQEPMLPDLVKQMVSTGDEAGSLALVCDRVASFYERELRRSLERMSKLAEPVMLVVMGVGVGLVVSSLILPIFKLSRAVH